MNLTEVGSDSVCIKLNEGRVPMTKLYSQRNYYTYYVLHKGRGITGPSLCLLMFQERSSGMESGANSNWRGRMTFAEEVYCIISALTSRSKHGIPL
jgi:hypothetical protein